MHTITATDGASIVFDKQGEGEPLVFIHGFSLDQSMWQPQLAHFAKRYQVITYDMRGFGMSSLPSGKYSHHQDLFELLNHLNLKNIHLVGLSLGGEVAIDFTLEYPQFVNTLTLADSSLGGFKSTVDWSVYADMVGVEKAKQNWLKHKVFSFSLKNEQVKKQVTNIVSKYSGWHWLHRDPRQKLLPSAKDRLSEIQAKTLIMLGEHDLPYYFAIAKHIRQHVIRSEKIIIPQSGHLVNLDNSAVFNKTLEKFVSLSAV